MIKEQYFRVTRKPLNAVCILIAAHSCLTILKSLRGALATAATAVLSPSATEEVSEAVSEARLLLDPDKFFHGFHFLLFPLPLPTTVFSFKTMTYPVQQMRWRMRKRNKNWNLVDASSDHIAVVIDIVVFFLLFDAYKGFHPFCWSTHLF